MSGLASALTRALSFAALVRPTAGAQPPSFKPRVPPRQDGRHLLQSLLGPHLLGIINMEHRLASGACRREGHRVGITDRWEGAAKGSQPLRAPNRATPTTTSAPRPVRCLVVLSLYLVPTGGGGEMSGLEGEWAGFKLASRR